MQCLSIDAAALGCSARRRAGHPAAATAAAAPAAGRRSRRAPLTRAQSSPGAGTAATPLELDEARQKMYQPKYGGEGAPEWNAAVCTASQLVLPDTRVVTLNVEVSRELVPLREAYHAVGRVAKVKVGKNPERLLTICSAPWPSGSHSAQESGDPELNEQVRRVLIKLRGDISAYAVKQVVEVTSIRARLQVWVTKKEAPEVFDLQPEEEGTDIQTGYFQGAGLHLRPFLGVYTYPTVLIFAAGAGIATAKALVECTTQSGLTLTARDDCRLYYEAPVEKELVFAALFDEWAAKRKVKVRPAVLTKTGDAANVVKGTVREAFDADDVAYDPALTCAVVLGDADFETRVTEFLEEAGLQRRNICLGSEEPPSVRFYAAAQV